jgi:hypothetical protein
MAWRCVFSHSDVTAGVVRSTLIGAALLAFAVVSFGAYRFASGQSAPTVVAPQTASSKEIHTTPDKDSGHVMPPPVAPSHTPS